MPSEDGRLVWIDLEMTGLDPERESIIEIATLVTGPQLELIAEGPALVIHRPEEQLAGMDEWNQQHHGASGLLERVRASTTTTREAELATLAFVREHVGPRSAPLCGNSVWQDRRFLHREMPELAQYLHYRNIDVSTVKELVRRWYPGRVYSKKAGEHRALGDIYESIAELAYYRGEIFR